MAEIINCSRCNGLYMENKFREVCDKCFKEEEKLFETVYQFLRKRENRAATMSQVIEVTGVEEGMLYKWIKKGRIQTKLFPNMGYPCEKCGKVIQTGRICETCSSELVKDLNQFDSEQERKKKMSSHQATYYTMKDKR